MARPNRYPYLSGASRDRVIKITVSLEDLLVVLDMARTALLSRQYTETALALLDAFALRYNIRRPAVRELVPTKLPEREE